MPISASNTRASAPPSYHTARVGLNRTGHSHCSILPAMLWVSDCGVPQPGGPVRWLIAARFSIPLDAAASTGLECRNGSASSVPVMASDARTVPSVEAIRARRPSGLNTRRGDIFLGKRPDQPSAISVRRRAGPSRTRAAHGVHGTEFGEAILAFVWKRRANRLAAVHVPDDDGPILEDPRRATSVPIESDRNTFGLWKGLTDGRAPLDVPQDHRTLDASKADAHHRSTKKTSPLHRVRRWLRGFPVSASPRASRRTTYNVHRD